MSTRDSPEMSVRDRVMEAIAYAVAYPLSVTEGTTLAELGYQQHNMFDLLNELECSLGIELSDEAMCRAVTAGDVLDLVNEALR